MERIVEKTGADAKSGICAVKKRAVPADIKSGNGAKEGSKTMFAAMLVGYLVATVAFYSYLVATAQEEPKEEAVPVRTLKDWQNGRVEDARTDVRKAA